MNFDENYYSLYGLHPPEKIIHKNLYYLDKMKEVELELRWLGYQRFADDPDIDDQLRADREDELEDSLSWYKVKLREINKKNKKFC